MVSSFSFIKDHRHSLYREKLLRHLFVADAMDSAAARGYMLSVLTSEVDQHGHDIVLQDASEFVLQPIQLKSIAHDSTTTRWTVNAGFFFPNPWHEWTLQAAGMSWNPLRLGLGGSVILQVFFENQEGRIQVAYRYSDFLVACLLRPALATQLETTRNLPQRHIKLTLGHFLPPASIDVALAMMGFRAQPTIPPDWQGMLRAGANDRRLFENGEEAFQRFRRALGRDWGDRRRSLGLSRRTTAATRRTAAR